MSDSAEKTSEVTSEIGEEVIEILIDDLSEDEISKALRIVEAVFDILSVNKAIAFSVRSSALPVKFGSTSIRGNISLGLPLQCKITSQPA